MVINRVELLWEANEPEHCKVVHLLRSMHEGFATGIAGACDVSGLPWLGSPAFVTQRGRANEVTCKRCRELLAACEAWVPRIVEMMAQRGCDAYAAASHLRERAGRNTHAWSALHHAAVCVVENDRADTSS